MSGASKEMICELLSIDLAEFNRLVGLKLIVRLSDRPVRYDLGKSVRNYCLYLRGQADVSRRTVTLDELADWLGITPRIVQKLAKEREGVIVAASRGLYLLRDSVKGYALYQRESTRASSMDSRDAVNWENARRLKLANDEQEKLLISCARVEGFVLSIFAQVRALVMNRSSRHANEVAGLDDPAAVRELLRKGDLDTLADLATLVDEYVARELTPVESDAKVGEG